MAFRPFRFLHAANVCLDHQLRQTGPLPNHVRQTVRDATTTAFERLVSACLEQDVDFLLLTGNTFVAQDKSLWALGKLRTEFGRLAERDIPVLVVPGDSDPIDVWQGVLRGLPDNVICVDPQESDPFAICCGDDPIATVQGIPRFRLDRESEISNTSFTERRNDRGQHHDIRPFTIGVATLSSGDKRLVRQNGRPEAQSEDIDGNLLQRCVTAAQVDYLALLAGSHRFTLSCTGCFVHHPGSLQGIQPSESGTRGGTLVEVDERGFKSAKFLPFSAVQWDRFEIRLHESLDEHEVLLAMRELARSVHIETGVRLWIVEWDIEATASENNGLEFEGPCLTKEMAAANERDTHAHPCDDQNASERREEGVTSNAQMRGHLVTQLEAELGATNDVVRLHRVKLDHPLGADTHAESDDPLEREFQCAIAQAISNTDETARKCAERAAAIDASLAEQLHEQFGDAGMEEIVEIARENGVSWLSASRKVA